MKKYLVLGMTLASGYASAAQLYDNGTTLTSGNLSVYSAVEQAGIASSTPGDGFNGYTLADDFSFSGPSWNVQSLDFYAFQFFATDFTFISVTWSILAGTNPNTASVVASGVKAVTNAGFIGYRVRSSALGDTTLPIYRINADIPDVTLTAGAYYVTWQLTGSTVSTYSPFTVATAGNSYVKGLASNPNIFLLNVNGVSARTADLPFSINGAVAAVPEPKTAVLMLFGALAVWAGTRARRGAQPI